MNYQLDIFDYCYQEYKIKNKIRLIEMFAGIGSQAMALRDLKANYETWKVVEFDKFAIESYNAIHGTDYEPKDIREIHCEDLEIIDKQNFTYLLTYSFPCQDLSKAGKKKGMSKGSNTRSGLLWEVERILLECKENNKLPQVLLMENVPDVIGNKNYKDFTEWYVALEKMGYQSYYKVLNSKDYGIPQNRARCFMVSILGEYKYTFPKKQKLKLRLKDLLESTVDEQYYVSDEKIKFMKTTEFECSKYKNVVQNENGTYSTLCARDFKDPKCVEIGQTDYSKFEQTNRIYDSNGIAPTLTARQSLNELTKIATFGERLIVPEKTKKGYRLASEGDGIYINRPHQKRGVVQKDMIPTLKTSSEDIGIVDKNVRVRRLTPKECWRLMGFTDEDYEKAAKVVSKSQLYKQAGNSIVKNVLMAIFRQLID